MTTRQRRIFWWTIGLGFALVLLTGAVMIFEERLIFFPDRSDDGYGPALLELQATARVADVALTTADGLSIHGWHITSRDDPGPRPVVLFLHGNAGNITYWADVYRDMVGLGADVFALDYRGFGRSEGSPDEAGIYRDADAAWLWLTETLDVPPERIVIYGFSLGGGVASWLAMEHRPAGLVLQSTFTSIPDVAASIFPPARWLVRTRMDSLARIPSIQCPILVVHGSGDDLVPYDLGRRLHKAAPAGTLFHEVPGAGHNETFHKGGESLLDALKSFITDCTAHP